MNTDEMPADRELDALVAEKVMGLEWREWAPYAAPKGWFPRDAPKANWRDDKDRAHNPQGYKADLPYYSADIAAAWEVVEHLHTTRHFRCQVEYGGDECPRWGCRIRDDGYRPFQDSEWVESAETAPLAICRAALGTVGE